MSVPAKKQPKGKTRRRRSHHALAQSQLQACTKCGKRIASHTVCPFCGHYKSKKVIKTSAS